MKVVNESEFEPDPYDVGYLMSIIRVKDRIREIARK